MENINLIRKIAWSFHLTTGLEWEDLFQEASLAYCEALDKYNPERGKLTTFMWYSISTHLKNYVKKNRKHSEHLCPIDELTNYESNSSNELFEKISEHGSQLLSILVATPEKYDTTLTPSIAMEIVTKMVKTGWKRSMVWSTLKELRNVCS